MKPMGKEMRIRVVAVALLAAIAAGPADADVYRVRPGDTLTGIAAAQRTTVAELARLNHLDPNGILLAGSLLRLPESPQSSLVRYRVQPGDTLSGIAVRYGTSVATIARLNHLDPAGLLLVGRSLVLPSPAGAQRSETHDWVRGVIIRWADHYAVDRALALSVAWMESGYQPGLTSADGAWGVMQVMPATWRFTERLIGHPVARTADGNVRIGVAYLHHLLHVFGGDQRLALAAYYQGPTGVRRFGMLRVTERYVADVVALEARM